MEEVPYSSVDPEGFVVVKVTFRNGGTPESTQVVEVPLEGGVSEYHPPVKGPPLPLKGFGSLYEPLQWSSKDGSRHWGDRTCHF